LFFGVLRQAQDAQLAQEAQLARDAQLAGDAQLAKDAQQALSLGRIILKSVLLWHIP
jgi:hypothetical protein